MLSLVFSYWAGASNGSAVNGGEICADKIGAGAVNNGAVNNSAVNDGVSDGVVVGGGGGACLMDEMLVNSLRQSRYRIHVVRTTWVFHHQRRVLVHLLCHQQCRTGLDLVPTENI